MKLVILLLFCFIGLSAQAQLDLSKLEISSNSAPVFLKPMLILVGKNIKSSSMTELELIEILTNLNSHFENYPTNSTKTFFMSEFYKSFFQLEKNSGIDSSYSSVSVKTLQDAKKKLEKNSIIMSKMSEFLLVEIFLSYQDLIISKKESDGEKLKKVNKYFGDWVGEFLKKGPKQFDNLVAKVAVSYLKSVSNNSKIVSLHIEDKNAKNLIFTNLELLRGQLLTASGTQIETDDIEPDPSSAVKNLDIGPTTGASEQIDAILEEVQEKNP